MVFANFQESFDPQDRRRSSYSPLKSDARYGTGRDGGSFVVMNPNGGIRSARYFHGFCHGKEFSCEIGVDGEIIEPTGLNGGKLSNAEKQYIGSPRYWQDNFDNIHMPPLLASSKSFGSKEDMVGGIIKVNDSDARLLGIAVMSGSTSREDLASLSGMQQGIASRLGMSPGPRPM
jgi:hypothetical protein